MPAMRLGPRATPQLSSTILIWGGLLLFVVGVVDCLNFTVDDTFISLRFAENLAAGRGLVFNVGERVEGYSNLLWTVTLSALAAMGFNQGHGDLGLLIASKAIALPFALSTLALVAWLGARLRGSLRANAPGMMPMAVLGLGGSYSFAAWTMSGMETAMCTFFVTLAVGLIVTALTRYDTAGAIARARFLLGGVAFGMATLVRPEQIFVWALAMAGFMFVAPPRLRPMIALAAVPTLAIHSAYVLWRWEYYGTLVPNSVVAKWGPGLVYLILGSKYAFAGLIGSVGVVGLSFLGLPALLKRGISWAFIAVYVGAYLAFVAVSGGDWMPGFRFFVPVYPLLWLLGAASLSVLLDRVTPRISHFLVFSVVAFLVVGSFFAGRSLVRAQFTFPTGFKERVWVANMDRVETGKELRALLPAGSTLALGECGYIPYFNPGIRILDLFGLMEPKIALMRGLHTHKLTSEYFMVSRPEYYLMMVRGPSTQTEVLPAHREGEVLMASEDFHQYYEAWRSFPEFVLFRLKS
jgi:hypothetical protein